VTSKTKTHIYHAIVENTFIYTAETWCSKAKIVAKLNSTEIDFWLRSARISRKDKIRNNIIKQKMNVARSDGRRPLGRPRRRWVDNVRMDLQEVGCGYMDCIGLAQDRDRWWTLVIVVMNLRVP